MDIPATIPFDKVDLDHLRESVDRYSELTDANEKRKRREELSRTFNGYRRGVGFAVRNYLGVNEFAADLRILQRIARILEKGLEIGGHVNCDDDSGTVQGMNGDGKLSIAFKHGSARTRNVEPSQVERVA